MVNVIVMVCPEMTVVVSVSQLDLHLVLTGRRIGDVERVVVTRIHPLPRQVVDDNVQMPDTGRWRIARNSSLL